MKKRREKKNTHAVVPVDWNHKITIKFERADARDMFSFRHLNIGSISSFCLRRNVRLHFKCLKNCLKQSSQHWIDVAYEGHVTTNCVIEFGIVHGMRVIFMLITNGIISFSIRKLISREISHSYTHAFAHTLAHTKPSCRTRKKTQFSQKSPPNSFTGKKSQTHTNHAHNSIESETGFSWNFILYLLLHFHCRRIASKLYARSRLQ